MIIQQINRTDPEKVFVVVFNNEGAALNRGEVCEWDTDATSGNRGLWVEELDDNADRALIAGVVEPTTIADQAYGLLQVYGYHSAVLTVTTATAGSPMHGEVESNVGKVDILAIAATNNIDATALDAIVGFCGNSINVVDTDSAGVFLRCM